jgi:hypothetical protein
MITFANGPALGVTLFLERAPFLLRVVRSRSDASKWDALDQLSDRASDDELIFVYHAKPVVFGRAFYDGTRNGRRAGWSSMCGEYEFESVQPADEVMRDNDAWSAWCDAHVKTGAGSAQFDAWLIANAQPR